MKRYIAVSIFTLLFLLNVTTEADQDAASAKEEGLRLYNQRAQWDAIPYLRTAAEAGDRDAQYFLAEALRHNKLSLRKESQKWYEAAATQGDIYAMLRLSDEGNICTQLDLCTQDTAYWKKRARETAQAGVEKGDVDALIAMYIMTGELSWLEKAAEAGSVESQDLLAGRYRTGEGWFFLPESRQDAVERWFKRAAEGGYPPAMMEMAEICYEKQNLDEARKWLKKSAESGYVSAVYSYSSYIAHAPDKLGYPYMPMEGYAIFSLVAQLNPDDEMHQEILTELGEKLSPVQREEAKVYAKEWARAHSPLSYFDPRFGL